MSSPLEVAGHPLAARDPIEARSLARDVILAGRFGIPSRDRALWLATRTESRRDLLFFATNVMGQTRLTEAIHRPAADTLMRWMRTPHAFGNFRDPRGNGKTTLSTRCGSLWCITLDPIECATRRWPVRGRESRLGITTLKQPFTDAIMRVLQEDLESDGFGWAFPDVIPTQPKTWSLKSITVERGLPRELRDHPLFNEWPEASRYPDPTFANGSLESGRAGAHTHGEFVDDPVNEKTWNSATCIDTAVHGIDQLYSVVRPEGGFRIVTGNHWCPDDVADRIDTNPEGSPWEVFMRSATACAECKDGFPINQHGIVPRDARGNWAHVHDADTFVWLMPDANGATPDLAQIRRQSGSFHIYSAQYENAPLAGEATLWQASQLGGFECALAGGGDASMLNTQHDAIRYADDKGEMQFEYLRDLPITIAYDPAHGAARDAKNASSHAITVLARTPADTFALVDAWDARLDRQLEAITELTRMIQRFRARDMRIAIESVGYQRIIKELLERELEKDQTCALCDGKGACVTCNSTGKVRINWLRPERDIVAVTRSKSEGDKDWYITNGLGPLVTSGALLVNYAIRNTSHVLTQLEAHPVGRKKDYLDSLTLHSFLWQSIPRASSVRREAMRSYRMRMRERSRKSGHTGYGGW